MGKELREAIKQRYGLEELEDITSIEPAERTVAALDDPQNRFRSFHVAGTNGKGSTCTMIAEILQHAGYDVGLYLNPALTDYRNQFQVNGDPISPQELETLAATVASAGDPTMYEFSTALAFAYFAQQDVDIAVVETGLGGRLDATNVLESDVSVLTSVSEDHTDILGAGRANIAGEKAAIISPGSTVVASLQEDVMGVVEATARARDADLHRVEEYVRLQEAGHPGLIAEHGDVSSMTGILAPYQEMNINTAITAVRQSPFHASGAEIRQALSSFRLKGRMEVLADDPLTIADGAHNEDGIATLLDSLERFEQDFVTLFSVMHDKQWRPMLSMLEERTVQFVFSEADKDRAEDPTALAEHVSTDAQIERDPVTAFEKGQELAAEDDCNVLITGSLYFIGDIHGQHS